MQQHYPLYHYAIICKIKLFKVIYLIKIIHYSTTMIKATIANPVSICPSCHVVPIDCMYRWVKKERGKTCLSKVLAYLELYGKVQHSGVQGGHVALKLSIDVQLG